MNAIDGVSIVMYYCINSLDTTNTITNGFATFGELSTIESIHAMGPVR